MASSYVNHFRQVLLGNSITGLRKTATELMKNELKFWKEIFWINGSE